jgi:hypothetical protein
MRVRDGSGRELLGTLAIASAASPECVRDTCLRRSHTPIPYTYPIQRPRRSTSCCRRRSLSAELKAQPAAHELQLQRAAEAHAQLSAGLAAAQQHLLAV